MKKKYMLVALAFGLSLSAKVMAQVPNYVPTNGLVGWWPFNGNANDESGNGNNGTVNGATFDVDRNNLPNAACNLYGNNDFVEILTTNNQFNSLQYTISFWMKSNQSPSSLSGGPNVNPSIISRLITGGPQVNNPYNNSHVDNYCMYEIGGGIIFNTSTNGGGVVSNVLGNAWKQIVFSVHTDSSRAYVNGVKVGTWVNTFANNFANHPIRFGRSKHTYWKDYSGILDDIGIWNRALSDQEILDLYNSINCSNNTSITPQTNSISTGGNVTFSANTSDANASYSWQSDFGQGYINLVDFGNYSGTNTTSLTISNVQLANHNQPIRAISASGNCVDTSNIATIQITDTCITNLTVYDTLYTTVTDTLIINTTLGLPAPNNENTILIYPNPASDHITIDNGNFTAMAGYSIKITNNAGQQVFQSAINQAQFYVDLSTWTGNGLYFVHILDAQNNAVTVRKIVLQ